MLVRELLHKATWKRWASDNWLWLLYAWALMPPDVAFWEVILIVWIPGLVAAAYWDRCRKIEDNALKEHDVRFQRA